jgi:hypothetical protein
LDGLCKKKNKREENVMTSEEICNAWDARDRLLEDLAQTNRLPSRTLYIRRDDGGTLCIGLLPEHGGLLVIDWKDAAAQRQLLRQPVLRLDPYEQKSEGFGGMFGFGEKGARGWTLRLLDRGTVQTEIAVLPNITAVADLLLKEDAFLNGKRRSKTAPHGQLRPEDKDTCERMLNFWEELVLKNA